MAILFENESKNAFTVKWQNGIQFADLPKNRNKMTALFRGHHFDRVCKQNSIY